MFLNRFMCSGCCRGGGAPDDVGGGAKEGREQGGDVGGEDDTWQLEAVVTAGGVLMEEMEDEEAPFVVLTPAQIFGSISKDVDKVTQVTGSSRTAGRIMLMQTGWEVDKLLANYYDKRSTTSSELEPSSICISPGVVQSSARVSGAGGTRDHSESSTGDSSKILAECGVCFKSFLNSDLLRASCKRHGFCTQCWKDQMEILLNGVLKNAEVITCLVQGCSGHLEDKVVMDLIPVSLAEKFLRMITNSYVLHSKNVKWCPAPGCLNAIKVVLRNDGDRGSSSVTCSCGNRYCFRCVEESGSRAHEPISCDMFAAWEKLIRSGGDAVTGPTKKCPSCKVEIEKRGGCNKMTCRLCGYKFCWICLAKFDKEEHNCVDVEESGGIVDSSVPSGIRTPDKWRIYQEHRNQYRRYLHAGARRRSEREDNNNYSGSTSYMDRALKISKACRETLAYATVLSYYLAVKSVSDDSGHAFRSNLEVLQKATAELMSCIAETPPTDPVGLESQKEKVADLTFECGQARTILISGVLASRSRGNLVIK